MTHFQFFLPDEQATIALGKAFAKIIKPNLIVFLEGELGAGKTALTRAVLHAMGCDAHIKSPTYTLVESYPICILQQEITCFHFDLYRLHDPQEFLDAGFDEYFDGNSICLIEWPSRAKAVLPQADIAIDFTVCKEGRAVKLTGLSPFGSQCLGHLMFTSQL